MEIKELDHLETLIGSLNKLLLDAKNKGIIKNKELSLLNLIYKLVNNNCYYDLKYNHKRELISLYYKILNRYSFLCKSNIILDNNTYIHTNITNTYINTNNNTAPVIDDPEEYNPPIGLEPILCELEKNVTVTNYSKVLFFKDTLAGCFKDPNNLETGTVQYMKIISLPIYNVLIYQDLPVTIGQIIDMNSLNGNENILVYNSNITQNVIDSFTYKVSTSSYPSIYSTEIITMNITGLEV